MPENPYFIIIFEKCISSVWNSRLEVFFQLIEATVSLFSAVCMHALKKSTISLRNLFLFPPAAFKIFLCVFGFLLFCYDVFRCRFLIEYVIDQEFQGHSGCVLGVGEIGLDKGMHRVWRSTSWSLSCWFYKRGLVIFTLNLCIHSKNIY